VERIEQQLRELFAEIRRLQDKVEGALPVMLTYAAAAKQLSISATTLKEMVRHGRIRTAIINHRRMVPASELYRVALPAEDPKPKPVARRNRKAIAMADAAELRASMKRKAKPG
jgi:hypothetical protein